MTVLSGDPSSPRLDMALVGCGIMGQRHLNGYLALEQADVSNVRLVAVCDLDREAAARAADYAERALGTRPEVVTDAADLIGQVPAVDLVTDTGTHHRLAVPLLEAGVHVLCEKPLGLTMQACRLIIAASERSGAVLATAENYRRDPANRLARAVLDAGLLGRVHLLVQTTLGGNDRVVLTPWRHDKARGAIGIDMPVHYLDVFEYLLGPIHDAFGCGRILIPERRTDDGELIAATGEDGLFALMTTADGAVVQMSYAAAGGGGSIYHRTVHGADGYMLVPPDRTGGPVEVHLDGGVLRGAELATAISFALDPVTAALFGGFEYDLSFERSDAAHLAVEVQDFAAAVLNGRAPEVDGLAGARACAGTLAVLESELQRRPVTVDEVLRGDVREYQSSIDESLGLTPRRRGMRADAGPGGRTRREAPDVRVDLPRDPAPA